MLATLLSGCSAAALLLMVGCGGAASDVPAGAERANGAASDVPTDAERANGAIESPVAESGDLPVDGGSIYYEVLGDGPPVVLIHGGFGDRRMWEQQFTELSSDYRVVRYDHRGFGRSAAPGDPYSPNDDLVRLLDHLGIERAHLVGNSLGGSVAIDFVLEHPGRALSLAVVASGPNGYPATDDEGSGFNRVIETAATDGLDAAVELWLANPMVAVTSQNPAVADLLRQMVHDNRRIFQMTVWPAERLDPPAMERLGEIQLPTLVVWGDRDIPLVQAMGTAAAAGIAGAERNVITGTDHLPHVDRPVEFNRLLREFLDRNR